VGQVNTPSNLLDRIKQLERQYQQLWKAIGLTSATIEKGGLTLLNDAFIRMVDDNGHEIVYLGPDSTGQQIIRIRREGGKDVLYTYTALGGRQYWALTDNNNDIVFSDDAVSGQGIARPHLPIPTRVRDWRHMPSSDLSSWATVEDTGYTPKQQPYVLIQATHCTTLPDTVGEGRVMINGVQVGPVWPVAYAVSFTDIGPKLVPGTHMSPVLIELQTRRTSGTGYVGASMVVRGQQS
jgi:hypothetical protein